MAFSKTYICEAYPNYGIAVPSPDRDLRFHRGRLTVTKESHAAIVEACDIYGRLIFPADRPIAKVSKSALELLEEAGISVEAAAEAIDLEPGGKLNVPEAKAAIEALND